MTRSFLIVAAIAMVAPGTAAPALAAPPSAGGVTGSARPSWPIPRIPPRAPQLTSGRPWLGVLLQDNSPRGGAKILRVFQGSPAARAGIRSGDIILGVGSHAVPTMSAAVRAVRVHRVGQTVAIRLERGAKSITLRVALEKMPSEGERVRRLLVGKPAPAFMVPKVSGAGPGTLSPQSLRGKVVLLKFWAVWCPACVRTFPFMKALHRGAAGTDLQIVAVCKDRVPRVASMVQRWHLPYTIGADPQGAVARAYSIGPIPSFVLIDRKGIVRDVATGKDWMKSFRRLLGHLQKLVSAP